MGTKQHHKETIIGFVVVDIIVKQGDKKYNNCANKLYEA